MSINGLPKNAYSRLFLLGLIVWSIVAVAASRIDWVQIGVGASILLYNFYLYHFIRNKTEKTVPSLKSLRDMMSGSLFLVIVIFFRFGVFIFTDFRFQLFVFIVEFFIYLSAIKIIEYYENVALEGVATEDSEKH
jgi:hypothetical protein